MAPTKRCAMSSAQPHRMQQNFITASAPSLRLTTLSCRVALTLHQPCNGRLPQRGRGTSVNGCGTNKLRSWQRKAATPSAALAPTLRQSAAVVAATATFAALLLGSPLPARSQTRVAPLTAEERLTINIFKQATPSVVNVTNLALRRDAYTMNFLELPQVGGGTFSTSFFYDWRRLFLAVPFASLVRSV